MFNCWICTWHLCLTKPRNIISISNDIYKLMKPIISVIFTYATNFFSSVTFTHKHLNKNNKIIALSMHAHTYKLLSSTKTPVHIHVLWIFLYIEQFQYCMYLNMNTNCSKLAVNGELKFPKMPCLSKFIFYNQLSYCHFYFFQQCTNEYILRRDLWMLACWYAYICQSITVCVT